MSTTLLLVDDDTIARRSLGGLLQRFGFRVVQAEDAQEALLIAKSLIPDVILSDYNMPGMNGALLLREIRRTLPNLAKTPFILFSGYIDHWTGTNEDPTPDVVLTKPVTIERLLVEINNSLKQRRMHDLAKVVPPPPVS